MFKLGEKRVLLQKRFHPQAHLASCMQQCRFGLYVVGEHTSSQVSPKSTTSRLALVWSESARISTETSPTHRIRHRCEQ